MVDWVGAPDSTEAESNISVHSHVASFPFTLRISRSGYKERHFRSQSRASFPFHAARLCFQI